MPRGRALRRTKMIFHLASWGLGALALASYDAKTPRREVSKSDLRNSVTCTWGGTQVHEKARLPVGGDRRSYVLHRGGHSTDRAATVRERVALHAYTTRSLTVAALSGSGDPDDLAF